MPNTYELKTEIYAGPIEKLLELIEEKELDVTLFSLSEVTADFLSYLTSLKEVAPATLADFIVVAARLILIKSKALLPELSLTEEEESDIKDLEQRLFLYKEFKRAAGFIQGMAKKKRHAFGRELFKNYHASVFYPSESLTAASLGEYLELLVKSIQAIEMRERSITRSAIISIEQKMAELVTHLSGGSASSLQKLAQTKEEMVVLFLAVLHLLKDRLIEIEQTGNFSDITIRGRNS